MHHLHDPRGAPRSRYLRTVLCSRNRRNEAAANDNPRTLTHRAAGAYSGVKALYSHVDLRVRDRERAVAFYDPIMRAFGFELKKRDPGDEWPTWRRPGASRNDEFFGFEVDANHNPNENRIAFTCGSKEEVDRLAAIVASNGARDVDGPPGYDDKYYACFFEDPDGNKLEVCFLSE